MEGRYMSKHAENIRQAYALGYRIDDDGIVTTPSGRRTRGSVVCCNTKPYYRVSYRKNAAFCVHKFAAYQWFGEDALRDGVHVRHLNGDSFDNTRANIAIGNASENYFDMPADVRKRIAFSGAVAKRRLTPGQAREVVALSRAGALGVEVAERFGVSKSIVSEILSGKLYSEATGIAPRARAGSFDRRKVGKLPYPYVAIVKAYAICGVSHRALAAHFGVSKSTIQNALQTALVA